MFILTLFITIKSWKKLYLLIPHNKTGCVYCRWYTKRSHEMMVYEKINIKIKLICTNYNKKYKHQWGFTKDREEMRADRSLIGGGFVIVSRPFQRIHFNISNSNTGLQDSYFTFSTLQLKLLLPTLKTLVFKDVGDERIRTSWHYSLSLSHVTHATCSE